MRENFIKKAGLGLFLILLLGGGFWISQKSGHNAAPFASEQQGMPPAMPVVVTRVEKQPVRLWSSYSGRLKAVDYVEIRPQIDGRIEEIKFSDGDFVEKGDVLFVIEPRPYEARLAEAQAAVDAAKNQHDLAVKERRRAEKLIKTEAVSQRILDERRNDEKLAENARKGAEALLERAQIDVDRAYVKAPISGRVSRAEITVGNLVQTGPNAPILTSIVSLEGIYVDFEVDEQTYLKNIYRKETGGDQEGAIPVQLILNDGSNYTGAIKSFDNRIDTSSGTIRARAYFENKDGKLLPGMFVTVRLGSPSEEDVILLSEQAIGTDQDRKFVYVVTPENQSAYREVKLGASIEDKRIIVSGLMPGEQVITEGTMRIMPGMSVVPQNADVLTGSGESPEEQSGEKK